MARYSRDFQLRSSPDAVFNAVHQYLIPEGYEYIQYDNENVFKKGKGFWTGPTFFKLSFTTSTVRLEAWMKYALLPGVYIGEFGPTGFVAAAAKGPFKRRIAYIEAVIRQYADIPTPQAPPIRQSMCTEQNVENQLYYDMFCTNCGTKLEPGVSICANCGQAVASTAASPQAISQTRILENSQPPYTDLSVQMPTPPSDRYISKRDFRNNYVPSFKSNLRSIAILCYVVAGINAVIAIAFNPITIIDSLILLGFTLGMHLGKSKVCAVLLLILGCIELIMGFIADSAASGALWLIAGIIAVVIFNKADKQYKNFIFSNVSK